MWSTEQCFDLELRWEAITASARNSVDGGHHLRSKTRAEATAEVPEGPAQSAPAPKTGKRAALFRKMKSVGGSKRSDLYDLTGARKTVACQ